MDHKEAAELVGWMTRRINGVSMSAIMLLALRDLKVVKDYDEDCGVFFTIHKATPSALVRHGWAVEIDHPNGTMHRITAQGEKALTLFSLPKESRRHDGICPTCGKRPKHYFPGGGCAGYCYECAKEYKKHARALKRPHINPDRLCSRCHKRPVHVGSTGQIRTYCQHCMKIHRRKERKRSQKRRRRQIEAGNPPTCYKCEQPVYYTEKSVYDYCYEHYREYQNDYNRRRAERRRQS